MARSWKVNPWITFGPCNANRVGFVHDASRSMMLKPDPTPIRLTLGGTTMPSAATPAAPGLLKFQVPDENVTVPPPAFFAAVIALRTQGVSSTASLGEQPYADTAKEWPVDGSGTTVRF